MWLQTVGVSTGCTAVKSQSRVPAIWKSNFIICDARKLAVVAVANVPLCRALHKGTYAEDPVMQRDRGGHALGSHTLLKHLATSST